MKATPKLCSRTLRGSLTSSKLRSEPASPSRATPNSSLPAKPWKASKPTASSQIPLTLGSRSPQSLSLLPHQSEHVVVWKKILAEIPPVHEALRGHLADVSFSANARFCANSAVFLRTLLLTLLRH